MQKVIAATLIAGAALTATAAFSENPGQYQEQRIAAALAKSDTVKAPIDVFSSNPLVAVFSFGSDTIGSLNKSAKGSPHSGGDRYAPPSGTHGGPDR